MAAYATTTDVQNRMLRDMGTDELSVCSNLLDDAAVMIDAIALDASGDAKKIVSCRMVIRALGDGSSGGYPIGASQGSMSGLGYAQSWTVSGGGAGELYIGKADRRLLGLGDSIGSYSPTQALVPEVPA